jgi:hypothetical protein
VDQPGHGDADAAERGLTVLFDRPVDDPAELIDQRASMLHRVFLVWLTPETLHLIRRIDDAQADDVAAQIESENVLVVWRGAGLVLLAWSVFVADSL